MSFIIILLLAIFPPCATEDAMNCGWDAQTQGNGIGVSYVDIMGVQFTE